MKWLLLLVAAWVPVQYGVAGENGIWPGPLVFLDECLLALLAIPVVVAVARGAYRKLLVPDAFLLLFILTGFASGIANRTPAVQLLLGIRGLCQYFVVTLALRVLPEIDERTRLRADWILWASALLQLPWGLVELVLGVLHGAKGDRADLVQGSIYSANALALFVLPVLVYFLDRARFASSGLWQKTRGQVGEETANNSCVNPRWFLVLSVLLCIPAVLGQGRFGLILCALAIPWLFLRLFRFAKVALLAVAACLVFTFGLFGYVGHVVARNPLQEFSPTQLLRDQMDPNSGSGRLRYYPVAWRVMEDQGASFLLGTGPGSFTSHTGYRLHPPLELKVDNYFQQRRLGFDSFVDSQLIATGVEFGILGLCCFYGVIFWLYRAGRSVRRNPTRTSHERALGAAAVAIALVFLVGVVLGNVWEFQYLAFPFWYLVGRVGELRS